MEETVRLIWEAEQPAQVAKTLLATVNEMDAALSKLGSQTAATFAAGLTTHLSSVREQVTSLRLEFERLGMAMGTVSRAPVGAAGVPMAGAGGFPAPITGPLGAALPPDYWTGRQLNELGYPFTPGTGGGGGPGVGGGGGASNRRDLYGFPEVTPSGAIRSRVTGRFIGPNDPEWQTAYFTQGGVAAETAQSYVPALLEQPQIASQRFNAAERAQLPSYFPYNFPSYRGPGKTVTQGDYLSMFGQMPPPDWFPERTLQNPDPSVFMSTYEGMKRFGEGQFGQYQQMLEQQRFAAGPLAQLWARPMEREVAFAGGFEGIDQARWFERQAYRMPGGMEAARAAVSGGLKPEEYERLRKAGEGAYEAQEKLAGGMEKTGRETDALTGRFTRHLTWIVQGILIWESFRIVGTILSEVTGEFIKLEAASARFAYISSQSIPAARGTMLGQVIQGAQYGIAPSVTEQGAILAAQAGTTPQQMEQARQISLVFGTKEYANALSELAQTQRTANAYGIEGVNVLGYLARAYKEVPVDPSRDALEQYMDSLQQGITVMKDLGLTAEQSALVVGRVAYAIEGSGEQAANVIQNIVNRLRRTDVKEQLTGYGITAQDIPTQLRQTSEALRQLLDTGQDQRAQALVALVSGGTINVQRIREAPLVFSELGKALQESGGALGNWDLLFGQVSNTTERRLSVLTASWQAFLTSMSVTPQMESFFGWLNDQIEGLTAGLNRYSQGNLAQSKIEGMAPAERMGLLQQYVGETGGGSLRQLFDVKEGRLVPKPGMFGQPGAAEQFLKDIASGNVDMAELDLAQATGGKGDPKRYLPDIYSFMEWTSRGKPPEPSLSDLLKGGRGPGQFRPVTQPTGPTAWEGPWNIQNLPEGATFDQLRTAIDKWDKILAQTSPEYTAKYGAPGGERRDQTLTYWRDPLTNAFDKYTSSQEALRLALEELNKTERARIIGVWNVPAGSDFMLPFAALLGNTGVPGAQSTDNNTSAVRSNTEATIAMTSAIRALMAGPQGPPAPGEKAPPAPLARAPMEYYRLGTPQETIPYTTRYERDEQFRRHNVDRVGNKQMGNITVNNRITVQVDGKTVSTHLNRQLHMQNYGRNMVGGNPSSLLTE